MKKRPDQIAKRTRIVGDCWQWTLALDKDGYGRMKVGDRKIMAHRWAYELLIGPIPEGMQIDHLCRNRCCVNPAHLQPVTAKMNVLRGDTIPARNTLKTHCRHGHPLKGKNLYRDPRGWRGCNACRDAARQKHQTAGGSHL